MPEDTPTDTPESPIQEQSELNFSTEEGLAEFLLQTPSEEESDSTEEEPAEVADADEPEEEPIEVEAEPVDEEPEEEVEDPDEPDLSQFKEKQQEKIQKRFDKLTAKIGELERQLEQQSKEPAAEPNDQSIEARVERANSQEDFDKIIEEARSTRKWARQNLTKEVAYVGDETFTHDQVVEILDQAEETLETLVPKRIQTLTARSQHIQAAKQEFASDEAWGFIEQAVNHPANKAIVDTYPNAHYLFGLLYEGTKVLEGRKSGAKTKAPAPTPPKEDPPVIPGTKKSGTRSHRRSASQKPSVGAAKATLQSKSEVSEDDLASYLKTRNTSNG